jgi:outer membrane immunogenic protein
MKKLLAGGIAAMAIALGAAPALSADLYVRPAPPVELPWSWSGFWVGSTVGYGWGQSDFAFSNGRSTGNFNISGPLGGLFAAYQWQFGSIVLGVESDINLADIKGTGNCPGAGFGCQTNDTWFGTTRGRLGYTIFPNWLLYGTGGVAYGDIRATVSPATTPAIAITGGQAGTGTGWAGGGGVELMLMRNWTARVEYLHMDIGSFTCQPGNCDPVRSANVNFKTDMIRFGTAVKF